MDFLRHLGYYTQAGTWLTVISASGLRESNTASIERSRLAPRCKHAPGLPGSPVVFQSLDCNLPHFQLATRLPSTCLPAVGRQYDGFEDLPKILSDAQGSHGIICALRLRARPRSSCPDHVSLNVSLITRLINFMCMCFYQVPLLAARLTSLFPMPTLMVIVHTADCLLRCIDRD